MRVHQRKQSFFPFKVRVEIRLIHQSRLLYTLNLLKVTTLTEQIGKGHPDQVQTSLPGHLDRQQQAYSISPDGQSASHHENNDNDDGVGPKSLADDVVRNTSRVSLFNDGTVAGLAHENQVLNERLREAVKSLEQERDQHAIVSQASSCQ